METIDFGCQVRVLHRQRLTVTPSAQHPHGHLSQCASQFLAKVRQMTAKSSSEEDSEPWMKLRLSERGLRIIQHPRQHRQHIRRDEGFESDGNSSDELHSASSDSAHPAASILLQDSASGGGSSGVNSSSSDIEEPPEVSSVIHQQSLRFRLEDILSCQHPPSLGRHVCLLTLKGTDALDILALECSAQEPARILTLLCQKISSNAAGSIQQQSQQPVVVPIQPWSERTKSPEPPPKTIGNTKSLVSKLERQNSGWMKTHLSTSKATLRRSETMTGSKAIGSVSGCSSIISLKTPEAPMRWPTFRYRPVSPEEETPVIVPSAGRESRGRSVERKVLPESPSGSTKIKRDQSKTRSFLMKLTSGGRNSGNKSPVPPQANGHQDATPVTRGRSLIRGLRGTSAAQQQSSGASGQQPEKTFLIPTKSGQELARNTYPKEVLPNHPPNHPLSNPAQQPIYHLVRPTIRPGHWPAAAYWAAAADPHHQHQHYLSDGNNNNGWIYFHPAPFHHPAHQVAAPSANFQLSKSDLKRIQRSRSQSPRRWLASGGSSSGMNLHQQPIYFATTGQQQPVSLPDSVNSPVVGDQKEHKSRSFRRSKSSSRMSLSSHPSSSSQRGRKDQQQQEQQQHQLDRSSLIPSSSSGNSGGHHHNNNKAVTFHAFATVQLVD